jgi:osmotically-inducible protein OsmY
MRTESQIKVDIEGQLRWNPDVDATDIGVSVKDGVVTLTGFVRSYVQKVRAEQDVKRVDGVVGVANDINVRLPHVDHRPDAEIARHVVAALRADLPFSSERVKITVKRRRVVLEGLLEWHYQRNRAELAALRVRGIKDCTNSIKLVPRVAINAIDERIDDALTAVAAEPVAERVDPNGRVVARGTVRSWAQRDDDGRSGNASLGATSQMTR